MSAPYWQSQPPLLQNADIVWQDDNTPVSIQFDDIYFSKGLGFEESEYVFLQGNQLNQRWQHLTTEQHFSIVETGFGTGLNFFTAAQLWQKKQKTKNNHLHYIAIEQFPISCKNMAEIWQPLLQETPISSDLHAIISSLIRLYPPAVSGYHRLLINKNITLTLLFGNAEHMLGELQTTTSPILMEQYNFKVDAWFLDGFAPAKNPTMWNKALFDLMANLSSTRTTFATFTAAGIVNRGLTDAGFLVKKTKGFGKKRNMLLGEFQKKPTNVAVPNYGPQWFVHKPAFSSTVSARNKKVAVIGGGLAGCHSAYQLAKRGFTVDVFEKDNTLAAAASGNCQGVLFHRLSHQNDSLSRFSLTAWLYATRLYQQFFLQGLLNANEGDLNGTLQLCENDNLPRSNKLQQHYKNAEWLRFLSPEQAEKKAGIPIASPAIEFINGGWLSPPAVCKALTQHANITIKYNSQVTKLVQNTTNNNYWQIKTTQTIFSDYQTVVIANSHNATTLQQSKDLPLQCVRGQVSQIPITKANTVALPQCAICHAGYITPPIDDRLSFGASFVLNSDDTTINQQEHQANIEQQLRFLPSLSPLLSQSFDNIGGRAEVRCTTPDYLPIVGPVANLQALESSYSHIRHNAKANSDIPGQWLEGLYLLTGLGSRGLTYGALAADILASQINAEPPPSDRHLIKALSPARFAIKNIIRQQTTPPK